MHSANEIAQTHPLRRINTLLSELGPAWATLMLTLIAVIAAQATLQLVGALGGPPITWPIAGTAAVVTIAVAAPIIFYSQLIIGKLRSSRRALKDVTSRLAVAVDHAEEGSKAKSAFLANMSHELRTPLNAIIGFSEMIRDQHIGVIGNPRYLSYADDIHTSGAHLLRIINDILDLSKIEAGQMSMEAASEFDVQATIEASTRIVRPIAQRAGVSLTAGAPEFAIRLLGIERMVKQVLINLLTNAVKFTPPEGTVSLALALNADGSCQMTVTDTGVGMTKEEIARALLPFGQVENPMNRKHNGTGLGLPLSKAMVELHEGTLRVQSVPQQGTVISLTFPADRVAVVEPGSLFRAVG